MFQIPSINNQLESLKIFLDIGDNDSGIESIEDDSTIEVMEIVHIFKHKNDTYQVERRSRNLKEICSSIYFNSSIYDIKIVN